MMMMLRGVQCFVTLGHQPPAIRIHDEAQQLFWKNNQNHNYLVFVINKHELEPRFRMPRIHHPSFAMSATRSRNRVHEYVCTSHSKHFMYLIFQKIM